MPDVTTKLLSISLGGKYKFDKVSAVQVGYTFQRLRNDDWIYYNNVPGVLPANGVPSYQTAPVYSLQAISAAYIFTF